MPEKMPEKMAGGGIMERLASLQKHGEEEWRRRITPHKEVPSLIIGRAEGASQQAREPVQSKENEPVQLRGGGRNTGTRPVSLGDRLSKLQGAQTQWQKKVGDKDTEKFTVAGKMERDKLLKPANVANTETRKPSVLSTPLARLKEEGEVVKRSPRMAAFQGKAVDGQKPRPVSLFAETSPSTSAFQRVGSLRQRVSAVEPATGPETISERTVALPEQDEELIESFFPSSATSSTNATMSSIDFDTMATEPLLHCRRAAVARPRRAQRPAERNPLRSLAARTDLPSTYTEVQTGVAEREAKRLEREREAKSSAHAHLAEEARAGLQSKEDFTVVQLRSGTVALPHQKMLPYRDRMLIQVKGRRFCQSRLVPPEPQSLNSGDCFVLVTRDQVFCWQGKFSNVIERSRSAEIAACVLQRKDLGCKAAEAVITVEEEKLGLQGRENRKFWKCLLNKETASPQPVPNAGPAEEDEEYEAAVVEASTVYRVDVPSEQLVPLAEGWGLPPSHELLKPDLVLVFDFGSEVYAYNGKNAPFEARKLGARLAEELWSAGWDYSSCAINPALGKVELMIAEERPAWTVLGRINSCMETILFREKFTDWPDKTRLIGTAVGPTAKGKKDEASKEPAPAWADLQGVSGAALAEQEVEAPDLELEGSHLGRGRGYYDEEERRNYEISTLGVSAWNVEEATSVELGDSWTGQFHTENTYVVRWNYKVALTGRALKGGASKHSAVGRERVAYFFWQGEESKTALQGASALQTVELDSEKGPQLRVAEGKEHAAFLQLWEGAMTIYSGRRTASPSTSPRLFVLQGELPEETFLKEVPCSLESLRARGVFLLILPSSRLLFLWIGQASESHQVEAGKMRAKVWSSDPPEQLGCSSLKSEVVEHGKEPASFLSALGGGAPELRRLTEGDVRLPSTPRLFHMTSVLGAFEVTEMRPDWVHTGLTCPLLHSQMRLYSAEQPALFLLDAGTVLYLWQGWQPAAESEEDNPNLLTHATGSGEVRWHAERRAAMGTALEYRRARYGNPVPRAELVWAGHEPRQFTHLFPTWKYQPEVAECNSQVVTSSDLEATYAALSRTEFTWEELQQRPLPPGVDPARIETYLSTSTFQEKFSMSKADYSASPRWKQIEMKKSAGLF